VIFLRDPMTPQPHEPDINALVRACDVHNTPCATNVVGTSGTVATSAARCSKAAQPLSSSTSVEAL
jgi:methylglyoxal synthase